ncbi:flagellar basal body L-ring protein FlgH [Myxococcota bacterium]|nr:flagellar basal body L-ring protein FlgH [Myxococcota bacterium]MBU1429376.1 flagellar basal body L-ring protein FlgH [Myxococcota bacterium]MBU1899249.1 flagellar basal body L-ring protein FlgH [Myxococcota bacterium]
MDARRLLWAALALSVLALSVLGCVRQNHYRHAPRVFSLPQAPEVDRSPDRFNPNGLLAQLATDQRAYAVNDVVVVSVDEQSTASSANSTEASKSESFKSELTAFFKLAKQLGEDNAVEFLTESGFKGAGNTKRSEEVKATVPCVVRQILPNGNLFIEGERSLNLNDQISYFYLSGMVSPDDIDGKGNVRSDRIAFAEVVISGDKVDRGWASKILDLIWPF